MRKNRNLQATVQRLAALEQAWQGRQFLAPVLSPGRARLRLEGLLFEVGIEPQDFNGFGVFAMRGPGHAEFVRLPSPQERDHYYRLWPRLQVRLLARAHEHAWLAWPLANWNRGRPLLVGALPETGLQQFEVVDVAFDGVRGWYRQTVLRASLRLAEQLAEALDSRLQPESLSLPGLTPQDRQAYALAFAWRYGLEADAPPRPARPGTRSESELRRALEKAGGQLRGFSAAGSVWNVHWLDSLGQPHFSSVRPSDLTVVSSGICLSGRDMDFDLTSLVAVMEGA